LTQAGDSAKIETELAFVAEEPAPAITTLFDLVALAVSLGLGLCIVTHSRTAVSLAGRAETLWRLALFSLHNVLVINMPGGALSQGFHGS
jgi:hypothetical protein